MRIESKTALAALLATTLAGTAMAQSDNASDNASGSGGASVSTPDTGTGSGVDADIGTDADSASDTESGSEETGLDSGMDADTDMGADVETPAGDAGASAGASGEMSSDMASEGAEAGGPVNYGQLISSLRANADAGMDPAADFEAVGEDATVDLVTLSQLRGNAAESAEGLDEALSAQEGQIDDLRSAIEANATVSSALEAEGYTADDVVAYETTGMGEVTLVVDDSE